MTGESLDDMMCAVICIGSMIVMVWFLIYMTIGTDVSGRDSSLKTTNMFFSLFLLGIGSVVGGIYLIKQVVLGG